MKLKNPLKKKKKAKDPTPMTASEDEGDDTSGRLEIASDVSLA